MIKLDIGTEPANFEQDVHQPGWNWLNNNPDKWWQENTRPPDYWKHCKDALETAQHSLCAYAAMLDPTGGSVDHFFSWQQYPYLAYAWENFRFASTHFNSKKRNRDDALLDPCEVEEGWFEISLPSLQMHITDKIPLHLRVKAEHTLHYLDLSHGTRILKWRMHWYQQYLQGNLNLAGLRTYAPLLAAAVEKDLARQTGNSK